MNLLLCSVFGPFGVDDDFGRKENIIEVLHNQVTREQKIFSIRFHQETYALHLLAENISLPTTVLDFPSQKRFISEIKKNYDFIGISFIAPNFKKAQHMGHLIRKYAPNSKIILGGHGANITDIQSKIPCDFVCHGDGVRFLREFFNEKKDAPINHPIQDFCFNRRILGIPISKKRMSHGVIIPGIGCVNSCRFCCTSHHFQKEYTAYLKSGQEVFDVCRLYEEKKGITDFLIQDENFFKDGERARELLALMEKHNKAYAFNIFSSAETVMAMGVDFFQRLGVEMVWIGVESAKEVYEKNMGIDFHLLVEQLRDQGVTVLVSGILFLEHHTKDSIHEDIDFLVGLKSDYVQFMQLSPLPGTPLYDDYLQKEKILRDVPFLEWHGQKHIWFKHPHFSRDESDIFLKNAFKKDYEENGPSLLRVADTWLRGAINTENTGDEFMKCRHLLHRRKRAETMYPLLDSIVSNAPNPKIRQYALDVRNRYNQFFGKKSLKLSLYSKALHAFVLKEKIRSNLIYNNMRQPKTFYSKYRN
ncbi:MAG: radical SAM protein [bacterium]|nr:radical SAM protein [bacterium]